MISLDEFLDLLELLLDSSTGGRVTATSCFLFLFLLLLFFDSVIRERSLLSIRVMVFPARDRKSVNTHSKKYINCGLEDAASNEL